MSKLCPTCHQTVPDHAPLPLRIRAILAESPTPLPPRKIRELTGTTSSVMYQTLRRMSERGDIRKSTHPDTGTGWVLVQNEPSAQLVPTPAPDHDPETLAAVQVLPDLFEYVRASGGVPIDRARAYLAKLGVLGQSAEDLVGVGVELGYLAWRNGELVAP